MERVVDRSELLSEASTPLSSPGLENLNLLGNIEFVSHEAVSHPDQTEEHNEELDFCLFAPTSKSADDKPSVSRIRLKTPPLTEGDPGILRSRDQSYYFTEIPTAQETEDIRTCAVTGDEVRKHAGEIWPGCTYDWKVLHIPATKRQRHLLSESNALFAKVIPDGILSATRKRPGKKARIKARTKLAATKALREEKQKAAELKEEADREKRTRRNREKKVKQKAREKAKKAATTTADVVYDDAAQDEEGGSLVTG